MAARGIWNHCEDNSRYKVAPTDVAIVGVLKHIIHPAYNVV